MRVYYGWVIVGVAIVVACIGVGSMMSLSVFLQPLSAEMGWSRAGISAALMLAFLCMGVSSFAWGAASDRFGTRVVVLAGGVLRHPSQFLADCLIERVRTKSPEVRPIYSRFEPVVGALVLALEAAGQVIDEALLSRLVPTLPPMSLFETE